jgi:hypothetical protein
LLLVSKQNVFFGKPKASHFSIRFFFEGGSRCHQDFCCSYSTFRVPFHAAKKKRGGGGVRSKKIKQRMPAADSCGDASRFLFKERNKSGNEKE